MFQFTRRFSTTAVRLNHPIVSQLRQHPSNKTAIRHVVSGNEYTYGQLVNEIDRWKRIIRPGGTVAIMGENSFQFVAPFMAALTLPQTIAMPLCTNHTQAEIEYQLQDSGAQSIVCADRFKHKVDPFGQLAEIISTDNASERFEAPKAEESTSGYMLYTSGTSGKPKGVVTPLETFTAQAKSLTQAWGINSDTSFLQTLPLHHVHGLLIGTTLSLLAGGRIEFLFPFSPGLWVDRIKDPSLPPINTYTAVPTVYTRIVSHIKSLDPQQASKVRRAIQQNLKLAMCGSAALPDPLRRDWEWVTDGQVPLLERYGMTETGITLSQDLDSSKRVAGTVGSPVPSVVARLVDPDTYKVLYQSDDSSATKCGTPGEIELHGPVVFEKYLNKPEATAETFSADGWFRTGDIATVDSHGNFAIQGRASMDIIKSGGEKISALEIEREILGIEEIAECSVIGLPNEEWGEQVCAVVAFKDRCRQFDTLTLRDKLKAVLAGWKVPKKMIVVDAIPRNQMGKVNKKQLVKKYHTES